MKKIYTTQIVNRQNNKMKATPNTILAVELKQKRNRNRYDNLLHKQIQITRFEEVYIICIHFLRTNTLRKLQPERLERLGGVGVKGRWVGDTKGYEGEVERGGNRGYYFGWGV